MSNLRNKVILIGNAGDDPQVTTLDSGKIVARFPLATNETYKDDRGEKVTNTDWHYIKAWGKTAEVIQKYVTKGKQVAVEGKLKTRKINGDDGNERWVTDVVINEIILLGSKANDD